MEKILVTRNGQKRNVGLINPFRHHKFVPNKWFDWERRENAEIMIIGQDWGPYSVLNEFIKDFDKSRIDDSEYYRSFMFKTFSSRTEKFIYEAVQSTYKEVFNKKFKEEMWDIIEI